MSQLTTITFQTKAGGEQTVRLQDYDSRQRLETWSDPDRALSGKLRHNLRGVRGYRHLRYTHSTEATEYRKLLNNILTDLNNGEDHIIVGEGSVGGYVDDGYVESGYASQLSNERKMVPAEKTRQQLEYIDQITDFKPSIELWDLTIDQDFAAYVEDGYVNTGYVE